MRDMIDPCNLHKVKRAFKGLGRSGRTPDQRIPNTITMLNDLVHDLEFVCTSKYETLMFKCVFLIAFLFRIGELICDSRKKAENNCIIYLACGNEKAKNEADH
jgi:hypothetical protein